MSSITTAILILTIFENLLPSHEYSIEAQLTGREYQPHGLARLTPHKPIIDALY